MTGVGGAAVQAGAPTVARSAAEAEWIERRSREVRARAAEAEEQAGWLGRLRRGLGRSSAKLTGGIGDLFNKRRLDDEALEDLEELLITADLGVETSARLTKALADAVRRPGDGRRGALGVGRGGGEGAGAGGADHRHS